MKRSFVNLLVNGGELIYLLQCFIRLCSLNDVSKSGTNEFVGRSYTSDNVVTKLNETSTRYFCFGLNQRRNEVIYLGGGGGAVESVKMPTQIFKIFY